MISRYRYAIDNVRAHNRSLWAVIALLAAALGYALFGWSRAPEHIRVHVPPDLRQGAVLSLQEVPPPNLYTFALYIWQQLNRWPENGAEDYARNLYALAAYLTPDFQQTLIEDMRLRGQRGELSHRVRGISQLPGHGYDTQRVAVEGAGVWTVTLDLDLQESVHGMDVKRKRIRYPLRVVAWPVDPERNPWGLALDGFAAPPEALTEKEEETADEIQ